MFFIPAKIASQVFFVKFNQIVAIFCRRIHGKHAVGKLYILRQTAENKGFCLTQRLLPRITYILL